MAETGHTSLEVLPDGVAVLTLDRRDRGANLLGSATLAEIAAHLDHLSHRKGIRGLVIQSAKPGMFIAGADLAEFVASVDRPSEEIHAVTRGGHRLFARLAEAPFVTIAAIDGVCLGGGAELAVWCDRRILTRSEKTQFGFPEVKIGLFPGWGGTARTPRMIGLGNAVEQITSGEPVDPQRAASLGLADDLVDSADDLLPAALRMVELESRTKGFRADRARWFEPIRISETELGFLGATASAVIQQQTHGAYPAPLAALELMLETSQLPLDQACQRESEAFAPLFGSPVNRALLNVFFLTDRSKKGPAKAAHPIQRVSVIGAGIMGQGIAAANVKRSIAVQLADSREEALPRAVADVLREASFDKQSGQTSVALALERAPLIHATTDDRQIASADVVIEAIVEELEAKQKVLAAIEPHMGDRATLCTNTSTLPIGELARELQHPGRFCGLHFFNPVRKMPLVEVIRGPATVDDTIDMMCAYARKLGKTPVVVNDGPGFLVNRLLLPYMNEAALLVSEGAPIADVERAARKFGMPMGPLALFDVVGLDTALHAGRVMHRAFPDRVVASDAVERLVEAGRMGQKNGRGFFDYPPAKGGAGKSSKPPQGVPSPQVADLLGMRTGTAPPLGSLEDRLILPMLVEATRAIEDGIVDDVRDVDLALILGIGFPPFRGGLFFWADQVELGTIMQKLEALAQLGKRFVPSKMLTDLARRGGKFYDA